MCSAVVQAENYSQPVDIDIKLPSFSGSNDTSWHASIVVPAKALSKVEGGCGFILLEKFLRALEALCTQRPLPNGLVFEIFRKSVTSAHVSWEILNQCKKNVKLIT